MPRIIASCDRIAKNMKCMYWPLEGGSRRVLTSACGFDTDEKWVEVYIMAPHPTKPGLHVMTADGRAHKARLHINFDILDKHTDQILYSIRQ